MGGAAPAPSGKVVKTARCRDQPGPVYRPVVVLYFVPPDYGRVDAAAHGRDAEEKAPSGAVDEPPTPTVNPTLFINKDGYTSSRSPRVSRRRSRCRAKTATCEACRDHDAGEGTTRTRKTSPSSPTMP